MTRDGRGPRLLPARILAALRPGTVPGGELPADVARETRRRITVAALLGAAAYAVFLALEMSGLVRRSSLEHTINLAHDVTGLGFMLALLLVTLSEAVPDRRVFTFALVTQVLITWIISIAIDWAGFVHTGHVTSLTWASVAILLFPLLVPSRPATTLVASLASALSLPGGQWLLRSLGAIEAGRADFLASCVTGAVVVGMATTAARALHGAHQQVEAARTLGSYELVEVLGQGGMGEVWRAQHLLLARPAAIKLILPAALQGPLEARDALVQRFTREAQVTASLRSPHTVELFDFGVTAEGTFYYAMELLEGLNVEHFVYRFGRLEPRRAVNWLQQVCHSLGEAHARGLVHRDIKPANLLVCRYGRDADFVKVLDFGLTRPAATGEAGALTSPGARLGTPDYMSPEQVYGLSTDPRTDLYALGCVGYWLLTGAKPFEAASGGELLRLHAEATPPPLSARAGVAIPAPLETVILSCLAKDPDRRPASADALGEALGGAIEGEPWSAAEAQAWWARNLAEIRATPAPSAPAPVSAPSPAPR